MVHALKHEYDKQWASYQNNHFINFFNQKYKHFQLMCLKIYPPYLDCCFQTFVIEDMPHTVNIYLHSKDFLVHNWQRDELQLICKKFKDIFNIFLTLSWRDSSNWQIILQHIGVKLIFASCIYYFSKLIPFELINFSRLVYYSTLRLVLCVLSVLLPE